MIYLFLNESMMLLWVAWPVGVALLISCSQSHLLTSSDLLKDNKGLTHSVKRAFDSGLIVVLNVYMY